MKMKELEKWVKEYNLIFKMTITSHVGCVVSVFEKGYDMPLCSITSDTCIEAIKNIHDWLNCVVENGGLEKNENYGY